MSGMGWEAFLIGLFGAALAALIKFLFDRWSTKMGWDREDRRAQDGKIERVDTTARTEIGRVERELQARLEAAQAETVRVERKIDERLSAQDVAIGRLQERVEHLPTADDLERLTEKLGAVERGLARADAKVDGINDMVRTIRDHIIRRERT